MVIETRGRVIRRARKARPEKNVASASVTGQAIAERDQPADQADAADFDQELHQNGPAFRANGFADPDLARPFGHGDKHDVHDADAADEQAKGR